MSTRLPAPRGRAAAWLICLLIAAPALAAPVDAPELAQPGPHAVGLRRVAVDVGAVPDLDALAGGRGDAPQQPRRIDALLWYPAVVPSSVPSSASSSAPTTAPATPPAPAARTLVRELRNHAWRGWPTPTMKLGSPSVALADAPVAGTGRLPVLVLSHGLLNWAETLSDLAEHLASRGYAVLALQHDDERHADPLRAALALRPLDQLAALRTLQQLDGQAGDALHQRLQTSRVALVGYSMGGYGALVAAGARVARDGAAFGYGTPAAMARHADDPAAAEASLRERVAAVVAFAPWGAQASIGAIKPAGLHKLKLPMLLVAGDQDDISGYADGTRALWQHTAHSERWLLTYENARHNIVQNGLPGGAPAGFRAWEAFEEPVWRRDRLLHINRHFVSAFLDATLRGDKAATAWLTPATPRANDGAWPVPFGTPATGEFAGPPRGDRTHWAGFQRRWAVGLRLERLDATSPAR